MRKFATTYFALLLFASLLAPSVLDAMGPNGATGTTARRYSQSTIYYRTDLGTLGVFSNATATTIAAYAFQQWDNVATANLTLVNAGTLGRDVISATDPYISGSTQFSDGVNPVVFDANGSITDAKLGVGANQSVIGFAGSAYSGNTYVEGYAIINGALTGTGSQTNIDTYEATMTHEIGHFLGLGHSQVSMHGDFCTMYPVIYKTQMKTLQPDDIASISLLYPTTTYLATVGTITGTVKRANGAALSGVNVIAENASTGAAYSTVVDYFSGGRAGFDSPPAASGSYTISGLPPGSYYVRIEPMNAAFTGGSSVASYNTPINTSVVREWYNAGSESGDWLLDNTNQHTAVSVAAGQTVSGINIIGNESNQVTSLTYHNGTPYYVWSIPQSNITKYATKFTAPYKGNLVAFQVRLDGSSNLPLNGTMTITVHQNAAGSLAGVPGTVLGSVTIPYSELAADQMNEIYLGGLGAAVNFDSLQTFHVSISTNGVGSPVVYTDNGSPTQNRTSYQTSDGVWRNFPDGGWAGGYNLIVAATFAHQAVTVPVPQVPLVSLSPTALDFGQVRTRMTLDKTVRLTNTGTGALNVTGMSILGRDSLDYIIVSGGGAFSLAPSAYRDIIVRFQPCLAGGIEGPTKSAKLYIASNAATTPDLVPLVGTAVEPTPLALVAPIRLGNVRPGQTYVIDTALVMNVGLDTLHASLVSMIGASVDSVYDFKSAVKDILVQPDSTYRVRIIFKPAEPKDYSGSIRMMHDGFFGYTDVGIIASAIAPTIMVAPSVAFGANASPITDTAIWVRNAGNDTLKISSILVSSSHSGTPGTYFQNLTATPLWIAPRDSSLLTIRFTPVAGEGLYTGTLNLLSNNFPDTLVQIDLSAMGVPLDAVRESATAIGSIAISPNPASNVANVTINANTHDAHEGEIMLCDVTGKVYQQVKVAKQLTGATSHVQLDLHVLDAGEYYLLYTSGSRKEMRKLVIVR